MTTYTPESAQALFTERLNAENPARFFCGESLEWLRQHPDLAEAWAVCDRPSWMLWWLHDHLDGRNDGTYDFAEELDLSFSGDKVDLARTNIIRARYTYWGEQRSPEAK